MKKITAAFDGLKYSDTTKKYAIAMAKLSHSHLVGVFMDDSLYTSYNVYSLIVKKGVSSENLKSYEEKDKETRIKAAVDFDKSCQEAGVEHTIHHNRNAALPDLVHESIYTDLLIISSNEAMNHGVEKPPTKFIRELLIDVQSPVLLVPEKYKPIQRIVALYDGGPSSVYAIKMFSYLFPHLKHLPVEVLAVKPGDTNMHVPDNKLIKEFMKRHFPGATYKVMKGLPETEITGYIKSLHENCLVVLGAYRRGAVSRWFRESMADVLMKECKLPLFIAHNK